MDNEGPASMDGAEPPLDLPGSDVEEMPQRPAKQPRTNGADKTFEVLSQAKRPQILRSVMKGVLLLLYALTKPVCTSTLCTVLQFTSFFKTHACCKSKCALEA